MRRKMEQVSFGRRKSLVYVSALVVLSIYGIPRLPRMVHGLAGTFTVVWILFVALCAAANLYFLVGADKERKQILERQELRETPTNEMENRVRVRG